VPPFQILVLGTGSHVGKSLLAAGLCRILSDRGFRVAPFKAQNMALNSVVAADGAEIGQAQALQALAARVPSSALMNPVLLKPVRGQGSQVILLGQSRGFMKTQQYFRFWPRAAKAAEGAWRHLAYSHQALVLEGAGSPAEVNLARRDLANLATARFSRAPWILVADIERGGSFAAIIGTLALVPAWLRKRCLGVVFNKFRGDASLMEAGLAWLKLRGVRPLGVLPYLDGLNLEQEDSLGLPSGAGRKKSKRALKVEVLRHPFIANFNDCLALEALEGVDLDWVSPGRRKARPDLLILPGTKDSLADLELLWKSGEAEQIRRWVRQGTWVLGLCGGFQMLGRRLLDPVGNDSGRRHPELAGLGLLDAETRMARSKVLAQRQAFCATPWGRMELKGYEIHHGRTRLGPRIRVRVAGPQRLPWLLSDRRGRVWGSYLHGLLDNDALRQGFLRDLAKAQGKPAPKDAFSATDGREAALNRFAAHMEKHLDLSFLPKRAAA
jgi:adenosylcobyric acid synthase